MSQHHNFDEKHTLHELKHLLPMQTPLKDFIHHNSLHAFQHLKFYEAIFKASQMFGFQVTFQLNEFRKLHKTGRIRTEILEKIIVERQGLANLSRWRDLVLLKKYDSQISPRIGRLRQNWKLAYHLDLDNLVQPLLFRIICSYLDQGIALWHFPFENQGLISAIRELEKKSFASFFKSERARRLLFDEKISIETLLSLLVGDETFYEQYLFDQQFAHRGWSGIVATIEDRPDSTLYKKKIEFHDFILLECLFEIDALDNEFGEKNWLPLARRTQLEHTDLFAEPRLTELHEVLKIWQDAFEWSYYDEVLAGLRQLKSVKNGSDVAPERKKFQAIFCIDERDGSLRRHLEFVEPSCQTLAAPGFFGVEFFFLPAGAKFYDKLCPAPITPKFLVKEFAPKTAHQVDLLHSKHSHKTWEGLILSLPLGIWAVVRLLFNLYKPEKTPAVSNAMGYMHPNSTLLVENTDPSARENNCQLGFSVEEMADRVEGLLRSIGLMEGFAPIIYVLGHGSSTANNPFHRAYDCGACSGRPGSVNARVFSFMANHQQVRAVLDVRGLHIPDETQFVGGLHDTASDEIAFYDEKILMKVNAAAHEENKIIFDNALNLNAKERSRRFASINTKADIRKVREAIRRRSVSYFEPRPELGHGTNALCFVGKRDLTKGLFLDRRAFMNSYDYRTDPDGKLLLGVMRPLPPVCGGINLEYYFSRVDNYKLGAGTKLPHNVMGLIGVANSSDGDLRPGLPLQMIEVHDPVRLLILVEHYPDVVLKTIQTEPSLYQWFENEWVHLVSILPETHQFFFFKNGKFERYEPLLGGVGTMGDVHQFLESAQEMETNYIVHATQENLPIHIQNH